MLIDEDELSSTAVVANCRMNRERGLHGTNGYEVELCFDPLVWLARRSASSGERVRWLDLCCGSGQALCDAMISAPEPLRRRLEITGVDLVTSAVALPGVDLVESAIHRWEPEVRYDLITCVHGLHYVGDKLGVLARAAAWLVDDGFLVANFAASSIRQNDGRSAATLATRALRSVGYAYNSRQRLVTRAGSATVAFPVTFLGADPAAGPNYTGQAAVNAHYAFLTG